jgi:hypothetical protein
LSIQKLDIKDFRVAPKQSVEIEKDPSTFFIIDDTADPDNNIDNELPADHVFSCS